MSIEPQTYSPTRKKPLTERIRERLALFGETDRIEFSRTTWFLFGLLLLILFLPLLAFPNGADNGLFYAAGQKIFYQGAVPYRDIVDVKPPLIYYLNAVAIAIFGDHSISMRLLDLIAQLFTCWLLIGLIRRTTGRDLEAIFAAILYALLYIGLNFANTSQVEGFVGLLILPAVWLFIYRRTFVGFLAIGILCGLLTFMKFTLGITVAAFLFGDLLLLNDGWRVRVRNYAGLGLGFGLIVALFFLYLTLFDAWHGFLNMQEFLAGYTGLQWQSLRSSVRLMLQQMPARLGDEYSLAVLIGTIWGIVQITTGDIRSTFSPRDGEKTASKSNISDAGIIFLRLCAILCFFLLISIAVEGKWFSYHLLRFFPFGVALASFGLISGIATLLKGKSDKFSWFVLSLTLLFFVALGPLSRFVFHTGSTITMLTSGAKSFDDYYASQEGKDECAHWEMREVGDYVRKHRKGEEKLFVSSGVASQIYLASNYVPDFYVFHAGFIIAPFAPNEWRDSTVSYLLEERPRFIVLQSVDPISVVTGTTKTSLDLFKEKKELWKMFEEEYQVVITTPRLILYQRMEMITSSSPASSKSTEQK
ncbi:MAG: glycosyltransferase family 39 protein [Ignavibacteriae bacterium]|nr:glycosyltransferase family 39 protein [Ignavibacteriota bacterium]MCB9215536.1 glycosyltransferase family 39 protein [Ignavibacteria bacterium]